jgi:RND family efflux transporter MFP subunit
MRRYGSPLLLMLLAACAKPNEYVAPPPPAVTVAPPEVKDVVDYAEFTGTTQAHKTVEIRARVKGFLAAIEYEPGSVVEQGTVLFRIDPSEYQANLDSAKADLESARADLIAAETGIRAAEASVELAETAVQKLERAYSKQAVSEILVLETKAKRDVAVAELDTAKANAEVAKSRVDVAQARVKRADLDLSYTTITAPITGRIAMWNVEVGGLVGANDATLLTTILNDDKIWCNFDVAERWISEMRKERGKVEKRTPIAEVVVELGLISEDGFPHEGRGDYVEPSVDSATGTLRVRAIFDNGKRLIPPGAFARVRVPLAKRQGALLVTERALGRDQSGSFVLVVNSKDVVERRNVELGARHGGSVVVLEGLRKEDRVIVGGLQRARPGATVKPESAKS